MKRIMKVSAEDIAASKLAAGPDSLWGNVCPVGQCFKRELGWDNCHVESDAVLMDVWKMSGPGRVYVKLPPHMEEFIAKYDLVSEAEPCEFEVELPDEVNA